MSNKTYQSKIPEAKKRLWNAQNKALREIGKFVQKEAKQKVHVASWPVYIYLKGRKKKLKKGTIKSAIGYYVFRKEQKVMIGLRPKGWFGGFFELGASTVKKQPFLTPSVEDNISKIRQIEAEVMRREMEK